MTRYWYTDCPVCGQGRLFVEVRRDTKALLLVCEECYRAWNTPEQVSADVGAFLAIGFESEFGTAEDIENGGWSKYKLNQANET